MSETIKDEKALLKEQATSLGIVFSPNIGIDTLKKKIADRKAELQQSTPSAATPKANLTIGEQKRKMLKLVHVHIVNLDPNDRDLTGEYFTVVNNVVGKIARMVPFNKDWHVEQCILDAMRDTKYVAFQQDAKKLDPPKPVFARKYDIQILPPLTQAELDKLAKEQAAGNRIDE